MKLSCDLENPNNESKDIVNFVELKDCWVMIICGFVSPNVIFPIAHVNLSFNTGYIWTIVD